MNYLKGSLGLLMVSLLWVACNQKAEKPGSAMPETNFPQIAQQATANPYEAVDVSPMDMSYFPEHYPLKKLSGEATGAPVMRVIYSRPHLQGRALFGTVLK